jgi:hypothetical protein
MLYLNGRSGTQYVYIHLNNDLTNKSEDSGGCKRGVAYAPGLYTGDRVRRGEFIGFVGDSGDAENGGDHLHFEIRPGGGGAINPYRHLLSAQRLLFPRPAAMTEVWLHLRGTVTALGEGSLTMRTKRVRLSNGWRMRVVRNVTLTMTENTAVKRKTSSGLSASSVDALRVGDSIALGTAGFAPFWAYARARPGIHEARAVTIHG